MPPTQINTSNETTYRKADYTLLIQAYSEVFDEDQIRNIFKRYGKIKRLKVTENKKIAHLTYLSIYEASAAVKGVHDKPPLKLQVDYYKKDNDFISRYNYTYCHIVSGSPAKRRFTIRRVDDATKFKKFHEMLQEASKKSLETISYDKLVVNNFYAVLYGDYWKRAKIISLYPRLVVDLIDDGRRLTNQPIRNFKDLGKIGYNNPFSKEVLIKLNRNDKVLHAGCYVYIRMFGCDEGVIHVALKDDEEDPQNSIINNINNNNNEDDDNNNNIDNKKSSSCPSAIKLSPSKNNKINLKKQHNNENVDKVKNKKKDDEKKIKEIKDKENKDKQKIKNHKKIIDDKKKLKTTIETKKQYEINTTVEIKKEKIDEIVIVDNDNDNDEDVDIEGIENNEKNIDLIELDCENNLNESKDILPCDICIFDSLVAEKSVKISISDQINSTTVTGLFQFDVKESFQLLDKLKEHCDKVVQRYNNYKPNINEYICFKKIDNNTCNWYRGIVLSIKDKLIKVASLDQGIETTADKIIPVPFIFKKFPPLSVQLSTNESHNKFPYSPGDSADLFICDIDKITKTVYAKFTNVKITSGVQITQWTPWIKDVKSVENIAKVDEKISTIKSIPLNSSVVNNIIPKISNDNVTPVVEKKSDLIIDSKKTTIKNWNIKNNSKVVVQSYLGPSVICITSTEKDDELEKQNLSKKIHNDATTSDSIDHPNIGDYVLVCHNDHYYRAKILSIYDKKIIADMIDYDIIVTVELHNIKKISEPLMNYPLFIKQVKLKNVVNNLPTKEAVDYIKTFISKEESLICCFNDTLQDEVELKTLDGKSVNDEINKLLKKNDDINNMKLVIPKPKPILRLHNIKYEESNSNNNNNNNNILKDDNHVIERLNNDLEKKLLKSKTEEKKKSELIETVTKIVIEKFTKEHGELLKKTTEEKKSTTESSDRKRKLSTETSSNKISSTESSDKKRKLITISSETSNKTESTSNRHKSSRNSSKDKSPESRISPSSSTTTAAAETTTSSSLSSSSSSSNSKKSYRCTFCLRNNHDTNECYKKDDRRLKRERRDFPRRRSDNYYDEQARLPATSRYPDLRDIITPYNNYDQISNYERSAYSRQICPYELCRSRDPYYDPQLHGPVLHCHADLKCPFRESCV